MEEQPEILFTRQEIQKTVARIAREIDRDYRDARPLSPRIIPSALNRNVLRMPCLCGRLHHRYERVAA